MALYPKDTKFIIGLGYKAELVKQVAKFIALENGQEVEFFRTNSWERNNTGLSQTVLDARNLLTENFVFHAVDSLIPSQTCEELLQCSQNTIVLCEPNTPGTYRLLDGNNWFRREVSAGEGLRVYTGVALITDTSTFWSRLTKLGEKQPEAGEVLGIENTEVGLIHLKKGEWLDCGTLEGLSLARRSFKGPDIVLERNNEAIWHINSTMYKFHEDANFIDDRVQRAKALQPYVPPVKRFSENIYMYERATGTTLSKSEPATFQDFLSYCLEFWFKDLVDLSFESDNFLEFYREKTAKRIQQYLEIDSDYSPESINGKAVLPIAELFEKIPWDVLSNITPVRAHGDLHPDNVIYDTKTSRFTLLDWRQAIGSSKGIIGDLYYELGKIRHGLLVDHEVVAENQFDIKKNGTAYEHSILLTEKKKAWDLEFLEFLSINNFDIGRTNLMTGLIYLNIAALHHEKYNIYLFTLGHGMVNEALKSWS
jgi:hypothetical protein